MLALCSASVEGWYHYHPQEEILLTKSSVTRDFQDVNDVKHMEGLVLAIIATLNLCLEDLIVAVEYVAWIQNRPSAVT